MHCFNIDLDSAGWSYDQTVHTRAVNTRPKCVNRLLYEFSFNEASVEFWVTIQTNYCLNQQVAKIGSDVCANHILVVYNTWTTCTPNFVLKVNQPDRCASTTERCRTYYCPSWNYMPNLRQNPKGLTNILVSNYKNPIEMVTWQINSSLLVT